MAQVEFQYNGVMTIIKCHVNQKMGEICNNFINKTNINENKIFYFYDGKGGTQFNKDLTFNQMANSLDKQKKTMRILVYDNDNINNDKTKVKSKNIICPECNENIMINIKDYKINLFECKNKHKINKICFNEFENTQLIDLTKIKCGICKEKDKSNTYNNEFYKCYECNINLCPLCKAKHNNTHNIYNYDKINYICIKHNEPFTNYCNQCNINICYLCEEEHNKHDMKLLRKMMLNKDELNMKLNELKKSIKIFDDDINEIMKVLKNVKENIDDYYKLYEKIINNYDKNERNYEILYNINELINNNDAIINDINNINNDKKLENKFNGILNIYKQIYQNKIKLILDIKKENVNKDKYFLDNTAGKIHINNKARENHYHDFLKELNELNVDVYINNTKFNYKKYFKPETEGKYEITLIFDILMKDCSFMFYHCNNITSIDLSSFNSKYVTDMSHMFEGCSNLSNIKLTSFNTENVTDMKGMFYECSSLTSIDLTSFNTEKVTDMMCMFLGCSNLRSINLSSFNTCNVKDIISMFAYCSNLTSVNLSSFNIKNDINIGDIFFDCSKLREIIINKNSYEIIKDEIDQEKTKIIVK